MPAALANTQVTGVTGAGRAKPCRQPCAAEAQPADADGVVCAPGARGRRRLAGAGAAGQVLEHGVPDVPVLRAPSVLSCLCHQPQPSRAYQKRAPWESWAGAAGPEACLDYNCTAELSSRAHRCSMATQHCITGSRRVVARPNSAEHVTRRLNSHSFAGPIGRSSSPGDRRHCSLRRTAVVLAFSPSSIACNPGGCLLR